MLLCYKVVKRKNGICKRNYWCHVSEKYKICRDIKDISSTSSRQSDFEHFTFDHSFSIFPFWALQTYKFSSVIPYCLFLTRHSHSKIRILPLYLDWTLSMLGISFGKGNTWWYFSLSRRPRNSRIWSSVGFENPRDRGSKYCGEW